MAEANTMAFSGLRSTWASFEQNLIPAGFGGEPNVMDSTHPGSDRVSSNLITTFPRQTPVYEFRVDSSSAEKPRLGRKQEDRTFAWELKTASGVSGLLPTFQQVVELAKLGPNWDGYDADQPSPLAYAGALRLALVLFSSMPTTGRSHVPFAIAPIADGGLQIEWKGPTGRIEVQAAPDGTFGYLIVEGPRGARVYREEDDLSLGEIAEVIYQFISNV